LPDTDSSFEPWAIESRKQFGEALTHLRQGAGLSIRELAARSGLRSATVGGYTSGRHLPQTSQTDSFRALLKACGVDEQDQQPWIDALARARAARDGGQARDSACGASPYRRMESFEYEDDRFFAEMMWLHNSWL